MWAVVLVPMWLRRHDTTTETRSVDRFSTAMRVLSRRNRPSSSPDRRYVLVPRKETGRMTAHVSGAAAPKPRTATARVTDRPVTRRAAPARSGRAALLARRRRMIAILGGLVLLTAVLAATGTLIGWPLQILVDVVLVAYVAHLRTEARRAAAVSRQRRRVTVATEPPARRGASRPAAPAPEPVWVAESDEPTSEELEATGTDDRWDPVPVPPPTYTLKPPAPPRPEPLFDQEQLDPVGYDDDAPEIDEILERRRAVND